MLYKLFDNWVLHTQEIEGVNSILKYVSTLAPSIAFALLGSRVTIKKMLNYFGAVEDKNSRVQLLLELEGFFNLGPAAPYAHITRHLTFPGRLCLILTIVWELGEYS